MSNGTNGIWGVFVIVLALFVNYLFKNERLRDWLKAKIGGEEK